MDHRLLFFLFCFTSFSCWGGGRASAQPCVVAGNLTFSQDVGTNNCTAGQNTTFCLLQTESNALNFTANFILAEIVSLNNTLNSIVASSCNGTYLGAFGINIAAGGTATFLNFVSPQPNPQTLPAWSVAPPAGLTPPHIVTTTVPGTTVTIPVAGMYQVSFSITMFPENFGNTNWDFKYSVQMVVNSGTAIVDILHLYLGDGNSIAPYESAGATILYPFQSSDHFFLNITDSSRLNNVATATVPGLWSARLAVLFIRP